MVVVTVIAPGMMIYFGMRFERDPPQQINSAFGYRSAMSMKNQDTWSFAHHYIGKLWKKCGVITLPLSIGAMLPFIGRDVALVGSVGGVISTMQVVVMMATIVSTEKALRRAFQPDGTRRPVKPGR